MKQSGNVKRPQNEKKESRIKFCPSFLNTLDVCGWVVGVDVASYFVIFVICHASHDFCEHRRRKKLRNKERLQTDREETRKKERHAEETWKSERHAEETRKTERHKHKLGRKELASERQFRAMSMVERNLHDTKHSENFFHAVAQQQQRLPYSQSHRILCTLVSVCLLTERRQCFICFEKCQKFDYTQPSCLFVGCVPPVLLCLLVSVFCCLECASEHFSFVALLVSFCRALLLLPVVWQWRLMVVMVMV